MATEKIFNTRLLMKIDTLENWNKSSLKLKEGELAFATVAASAGAGIEEPVVMVKIGTAEEKVFKDLPWAFHSKASDVLAACKSEATLKTFINNVLSESGIATNDSLSALSNRVTTNESGITALKGLVGEKSVATQISEALALLKLDETYEAKGAADEALADAKEYSDGLNTAMDSRVLAVEGKVHEHSNKAELDKIAEGDKAKWDGMEQKAKDYADGLDGVMDVRVKALEGKFGDGEGNVESQIASAVATETEAREAADTDLDERLKVVEGDYLKTTDKTGLQDQITSNDNDISALRGLVGEQSVATQVSTAVEAEAKIARAAEKANSDAIADIKADYLKAADKIGLQEQITTNANAIERLTNGVSSEEVDSVNDLIDYVNTHGTEVTGMKNNIQTNANAISGLDTRMGAAETAIGTKAAQSDLDTLSGSVTTIDGKVTTLEGEMDTAQGDIATLKSKMGDSSVSEQVSAVTNPISEKVTALEGKAHEHANKDVIDGVSAEDVSAWDAKVDDVTAAADSGLKVTRTGNTVAIELDDSITFVFDCGDSNI